MGPPSDVNLYQCSANLLDHVYVNVNKAVVFCDDPFAEILHWHGGATSLFNAGVLDVREFSSFESGDGNQQKAAFFISTSLNGAALNTLEDIIRVSNFRSVVVFSNIPPVMHSIIEYHSAEDEMKAFNSYRMQILRWLEIKNENCVCEIQYLPMVVAPILPSLFVLPTSSNVFPLLPTDIQCIKQKHRAENRALPGSFEIEFGHLPRELQLRLKLLVCSLNSLMELLSVSEEVFAIGATSNMVATELASLGWNKARKKAAAHRKASLLIVDRTLDMASVVGHFQDTLMDKILSVLPRLPGHHNDVCVDMTPICAVISNPNFVAVAPGCLSHPDDPIATPLLNTISMLKQKEAMMEVNRHLTEAIMKESFVSTVQGRPGKVGVDQLKANIALFKENPSSIRKHCGMLQLVMAATETTGHPSLMKVDSQLALEKGLLQCLGDDDAQSPTTQILQILKKDLTLPPSERLHSASDILLLLAFIYSLSEDLCDMTSVEEAELKSALSSAIAESSDADKLLQQLDSKYSKDRAVMVADLLDKLRSLPRARSNVQRYRNVHEPGSLSSQARLKPLLKQIVEDIVDPGRPDLVDVTHKAVGFGEMLKSGFGFLRAVSKPRPSDHPLLIVFVLGGITTTEVRQIRDSVSAAKSNVQVLVGSTRLVSPIDVLQMTIVQDNLLAGPEKRNWD